ncbi:thymidine phosphorylase [Leptolinea tardivitalis]|uniref:Thymidine phosphorylase n=1 Tax=Leptolinea tardivitalis TaxID=229920 RepID=A0A0P6XAP9_9CHLR|nr:thymidine phosphorylase [Leptolinea tardivitalis]KPL71699.1 thymidine phosphorylase [Leptolinea tardivitalis]GAP20046.1 thymidine phosphorylase [Leptolinea tardivitalis]
MNPTQSDQSPHRPLRAVDIIIKKRDGLSLSKEEIDFFIKGYTAGEIPDYQASALLMAILLRGMTDQEATDLTMAMAHSGEILDLSPILGNAVDKHSTGGVGDKTTLVVEPVVATCGLKVAKMSGRGLGFSGGTLDKLESIPGYRVNLSRQEFLDQVSRIGIVLSGQSADLAPADGKLYALRDVTGTVPSIPLIASSIMSKKIAAGAHTIVLDVKTGNGAFMETLDDARKLARLMVSIGRLSGRKVIALLSDMNQPLGCAVGNALELAEAIDTLHGGGPHDFREHCLEAAGYLLVASGKSASLAEAKSMAARALSDDSAFEKFRLLVQAQGGDIRVVDDPSLLPKAAVIETIRAEQAGWISGIHARVIGETVITLGGGRARKTDSIDHSVGVVVHVKVGDQVEAGQPLVTIHAKNQADLGIAKDRILSAISWSDRKTESLPLFYGVIE